MTDLGVVLLLVVAFIAAFGLLYVIAVFVREHRIVLKSGELTFTMLLMLALGVMIGAWFSGGFAVLAVAAAFLFLAVIWWVYTLYRRRTRDKTGRPRGSRA